MLLVTSKRSRSPLSLPIFCLHVLLKKNYMFIFYRLTNLSKIQNRKKKANLVVS